jgi:hypothetical protein
LGCRWKKDFLERASQIFEKTVSDKKEYAYIEKLF